MHSYERADRRLGEADKGRCGEHARAVGVACHDEAGQGNDVGDGHGCPDGAVTVAVGQRPDDRTAESVGAALRCCGQTGEGVAAGGCLDKDECREGRGCVGKPGQEAQREEPRTRNTQKGPVRHWRLQ